MPIVILLLLAALVATFGFWSTLKAIIGAIGVIVLLCLLLPAKPTGSSRTAPRKPPAASKISPR